MTNKALQSPQVAVKDTTLLASLLLDLFEKITNNERRHIQSWTGHVNGALALVRLRGLEQFQDPSTLRALVRLSTNLLISCVASDAPAPDELNELRAHARKYLDVRDPKWRLSDLMVHYANLRSDIRRGHLSIDDCISTSIDLDRKLQTLTLDMPPSWQHKTTIIDSESERIYNRHFDTYPDRHVTQTRNVLRLVRVLLNEYILENCPPPTGALTAAPPSPSSRIAHNNINTLASEICASAPQYVDCLGASAAAAAAAATARDSPPMPAPSASPEPVDSTLGRASHQQHSPSQILDCYTLIFPLYIAGWSKGSPNVLKLVGHQTLALHQQPL
jgi:hypothetical protein